MKGDLIRLFCYLDVAGIESLDAQTGDFVRERRSDRATSGKAEAGAEISLKTLLRLLPGLKADAKVGGELTMGKSSTAEIRPEHRLAHVVDWLEKKRQLKVISDPRDLSNPDSGFVVMNTRFETPDLTQIADLRKSSDLAHQGLTSAPRAPDFIRFFSTYRTKPLVMTTSIAKFRMGLHHYLVLWDVGRSSPSATQFWVFGFLSGANNKYALKPFAIAHE